MVSRVSPSFFRFGSFEIFIKGVDRVGPSEGKFYMKYMLNVIFTTLAHTSFTITK